ncbi:MAG: hypothetical protein E7069_02540 [Bacteroidales bacterium]|jgi:VanZ family protein|nr:hypothetical protein [Bacteroidales bacterium]
MQLLKERIYRLLSFVPVMLILCFIFAMSDSEGKDSASLSMSVSHFIMRIIIPIVKEGASADDIMEYAVQAQWYIRKCAHITEFFLLTAALLLPVEAYHNRLSPRALIISFFIAISMAAVDEYHQSFIEGRVSTPYDVLIDSIGIVIATITAYTLHKLNNKRNSDRRRAEG